MSRSVKEKITCCNCHKRRVSAGYSLCKACYRKFMNGDFHHPLGMSVVRRGYSLNPPVSTVKEDSDVSTLCDHNPHGLPFYVEEHPADPDRDPFEWWDAA